MVSGPDEAAYLRGLRGRLAKLYHDLNNPLAILSGNIQLVRELATATGLDHDIVASLNDAGLAADQLAERLNKLLTLREELDARIGSEGSE